MQLKIKQNMLGKGYLLTSGYHKPMQELCISFRQGYFIPFSEMPPFYSDLVNSKSCDKSDLALREMLRLEKRGWEMRVVGPSLVEMPLFVVFSNKWRLVVDDSRHKNPAATR